jgi:hypothetical protein
MKTIKFTDEQLLILNEALVKMPFEKVVYLINDINNQINEQNKLPPAEMSASELGYVRSGSGATK